MGEREIITAAALRRDQLIIFMPRPYRHHDIFYALGKGGMDMRIGPEQQGFMTNKGRFVSREEARKIAEAADQIIASERGRDGVPFKRQHSQLFSEDVW